MNLKLIAISILFGSVTLTFFILSIAWFLKGLEFAWLEGIATSLESVAWMILSLGICLSLVCFIVDSLWKHFFE